MNPFKAIGGAIKSSLSAPMKLAGKLPGPGGAIAKKVAGKLPGGRALTGARPAAPAATARTPTKKASFGRAVTRR